MEQLRIDLVPMGVTPNAHASQFDVGRVIRFLLYNGGTAYTLAGTETITVKMAKPDGTEETVSVTNTSSNYVDFITTDGLLNQAGLYPCEISITSGTDVIGSKNFNLRVELDPYDGHNIRTVTVGPADICTFDTTLPEPYQSVTVNVEATGGNGTPDNPIPINGYTEANITRCGVNLFDIDTWLTNLGVSYTKTGDVYALASSSMIYNNPFIVANDDIPITLSAKLTNGTSTSIRVNLLDKNNTVVATLYENQTSVSGTASKIRFNWSTGGTFTVEKPQVECGSTPSAYSAYNSITHVIAFGQTVYGGVLDVTRGKLTVTWGGDNIGSLNWSYSSADGWFQVAHTHKTSQHDAMCSCFPVVYNLGGDFINESLAVVSGYLAIKDSTFGSDANALKTALNGQMVVYELATPVEIDLTGVQIRALVGENNVFADCGETTVEYLTEE